LLVTSPSSITGFIIAVLILLICIASLNKVKDTSYNIFIILHSILYLGILIMLSFHGCFCFLKKPNGDCYDILFWKYIIIPFILFIAEKVYREYHANKETTFSSIKKYNDYYLLQFYKQSFEFNPGQWILINCPEISRFEWHPFTLTSNSNEKGNIEIFIKNKGDWTNKFINILTSKLNDKDLKVKISYPYGYRFNLLSKCRVIVLIAGGVGITRFISLIRSLPIILCKDIKHNYLQKVDLHWVCKDNSDFNCFMNILKETKTKLNEMGHYHLFNIQLYVTQTVQDIYESNYTLFNYNYNRPNFEELFLNLTNKYDENTSIQILFCGIKDIHYDIVNNMKKIKKDKTPLFIYKNLN
jgi:NADPH oxidase